MVQAKNLGTKTNTLKSLNSVLGVPVNVKHFGAVGDGVTDDAIAFDAAINYGRSIGSTVLNLGSAKTYFLTGERDVSGFKIIGSNVTIVGDGSGYMLSATGSISAYTALNSNVLRGSKSIDSALASSLAKGDLVKIISDLDFSAGDTGRKQGEIHIVESIVGTTINFIDTIFDDYAVLDNVRVAKITPTTFAISDDITLMNVGVTADSGLRLKYVYRGTIRGNYSNFGQSAILLDDCYAPDVEVFINSINYEGTGTSYGVSISNATMYPNIRGDIFWCRHAVAHGGNFDHGVVWESFVQVRCTASSVLLPVLDAHPSTGSVHWNNCVINCSGNGSSGGIKINARYNRVTNVKGYAINGVVGPLLETSNSTGISVKEIKISGLISNGFSSCLQINKPVESLDVSDVEGDNIGIYIANNVNKWAFRNISTKSTGIIIYNVATVLPSKLEVTGLHVINDILGNDGSTAHGIYNLSPLVTEIVLNNPQVKKTSTMIRTGVPMNLIEINNGYSDEPNSSHIYASGIQIDECKINGGVYKNNRQSGTFHGAIIKANVTTLVITGASTSGANLQYIGYGTIGMILHSVNNFHVLTALVGGSTPLQVTGGSQNGRRDMAGVGSPEGAVVGKAGDTYTNLSGGAGATFFIKESGTGNTGWIAK